MKKYLSILRGINVGGHKTVKMDKLKSMYEDIGFQQVKTYLQSGNVIFQTHETAAKTLENMISIKITEIFGFDAAVIVLAASELQEIICKNPFAGKKEECTYITILSEKPQNMNIEKLDLVI
jgi:uncharacterized protein (DUF1697 family)